MRSSNANLLPKQETLNQTCQTQDLQAGSSLRWTQIWSAGPPQRGTSPCHSNHSPPQMDGPPAHTQEAVSAQGLMVSGSSNSSWAPQAPQSAQHRWGQGATTTGPIFQVADGGRGVGEAHDLDTPGGRLPTCLLHPTICLCLAMAAVAGMEQRSSGLDFLALTHASTSACCWCKAGGGVGMAPCCGPCVLGLCWPICHTRGMSLPPGTPPMMAPVNRKCGEPPSPRGTWDSATHAAQMCLSTRLTHQAAGGDRGMPDAPGSRMATCLIAAVPAMGKQRQTVGSWQSSPASHCHCHAVSPT